MAEMAFVDRQPRWALQTINEARVAFAQEVPLFLNPYTPSGPAGTGDYPGLAYLWDRGWILACVAAGPPQEL